MVGADRLGGVRMPFQFGRAPKPFAFMHGGRRQRDAAGNQARVDVTNWLRSWFRLWRRLWRLWRLRRIGRVVTHLQGRLEIVDHAALVAKAPLVVGKPAVKRQAVDRLPA